MTDWQRLIGFSIIAILVTACASTQPEHYRARLSSVNQTPISSADVTAEIEFGRRISAAIVGRYDGIENESLQRYVNLVGSTLAQHSRRPELDFYFYVLESSQVNAYAAPGGYVFITSGALDLMTDEAELAAVLAHEIAHIDQRHIVHALNIEATDSSAGLAQMLGGASETTRVVFSQAVDQALDILFEKGLEPADEMAADSQAVFILAAAGYDPYGLPRFLSRMPDSQPETLTQMHDTHPPLNERLAVLHEQMLAMGMVEMERHRMTARFAEQLAD